MSHLNSGLLSTYNSLTDKHLAGYFSNTRIRRHLQRAGLITRSGRIVPDKEYRHKLIQRAHQRHVRECLAQAIFHKVLEMERLHQIEIKRKLEEFARRERMHKIKVERSKRYEEGIVHILSPHPPAGARGIRKQHSGPEGEHSESSESDAPLLRSSVHQSRVCVNVVYFGKTVRLSSDLTDMRDDVKVFQQHCGGENLCVYKGKLHEGETFQFISRRHRGFPFSLTFFLNGLQVERLSSCCEFKHRKGSRLGGKHGHFGFTAVEGASPCYKCIIAMGLDKKPTPPPKRMKEDTRREESVNSPNDEGEMETERTGEDAGSHLEGETSEPQNMETPVKEERALDEEKGRDDYEEDFEADDEGAAEEAKEEKSPSPTSERDKQVKDKDASETENDDRDDMRSHSGSSSSGSEHEESDAEATRDINEDEMAEQQKEDSQEETIAQPEEKDEPDPEEDVATEAECSAAKDSHMDSAGDSTEIEISDTSVPSGSETRQSDDKEAEKTLEEGKQEEEQERAKSVQDKLAEAILKESQCSSEPELSDTSTEEEEESTHKGPQQDNKDAAPVKLVTPTEQQQTIAEEAQTQEDLPETKEQSGDDEQEPQENRDITEDEKVEEDDKAAEEEDKSEETGEALHPSKEENVTQDDKTTEPLEETPAETTDTEAAEKEERKEKTAEETDVQRDETGQVAKSSEEDESSVSEPDKKTDETAAADNAEAVTARETIEIKAESSKEQEALSYEEAPVSDAEKGEQADSEDRAAGSETEVTAENSSSSPSGSGETTVEKIADTDEENAIEESSKDDIKEERILEDESHEQCELREERIGASEETGEKEDEEKTEEGGKEEEEKQTHVTSDKGEEDENTEKRDDDEKVKNDEDGNEESKEDEGTENTAESADNGIETKEDEEEAVKTLSEEDKVADDEKVEEPEKTENDENSECVENKLEESEVMEGDKSEDDNENETKPAVQENDDEAEISENQNENKAEKSEDKESKNDEEDNKEKDISETPVEGEEISETTEEAEKSADVGVNEAADGTKSADETPEAESVEQDAGKTSNTSEKEEINAENGEISTEAESNNHKDDGESQLKDKNDLKNKEEGDEESKPDGPADDESADIKEVAVESEDGAETHDADEVDQAPGADAVERDAKEEGDSVEKNDESTPSNSQPETEMEEEPKLGDRKDSEEAEQDQNGNKSDCDHENKEPDLIKKESSTEENMDEVAAVSSGNQEQSPVAVDLDVMASKLDEKSKDTKSDICPQTDENAVGGDLSAADGENGVDTEDASKASEEGASVLLKPHAQNNEADNTEETVATGRESPEALAKEDSTDLVSNWVNKHQSSKFFETFVEPLEDMREEISDAPVSSSNKEETKSTELPRSDSPLKMERVSEDEVKAYRDVEDELQVEEKAEVKDLILKPETEQSEEESAALQEMRSEEHKGSMGSLQGQESAEKGINEENAFSKTEVESTSGSHHSATEKPASVSKSQPDEKTSDNDFDVKEPQTEEGDQSTSPLGTKDVKETWRTEDEQSREVTETTDFTTSKSDDGSPEDSRNEEIEGKASDRSVSRDRKDLQLIEDIKHTLSKDRLSAFSVDDTLFAHSSYPLLAAASAESGSGHSDNEVK
ncbi:glutamate-rich protein 3 isoform X4 [Oreochromis niloticus]|uniref:glutamate-rich protein 3 isoform X4 n=1 Tax=Oreochromis niloticus TaxID=8128 RepID=UPI0003940CC4|nr:glutamate-rich protein 3 isoform X4 [Oreochromis niloticus]